MHCALCTDAFVYALVRLSSWFDGRGMHCALCIGAFMHWCVYLRGSTEEGCNVHCALVLLSIGAFICMVRRKRGGGVIYYTYVKIDLRPPPGSYSSALDTSFVMLCLTCVPPGKL